MKFVNGSELSKAIQAVLVGRGADMAVAFWGRGACERLALPRNANGTRVACDARSGGVNPAALADLLKRKAAVVDVPGLHAKVYIGEEGVVITSANASANGLGEEGEEVSDGLEAGYITERRKDIEVARQWFETIYKQGEPVTKSDLPELRALWRERQTHRPIRAGSTSFMEVLLTQSELLRDRNLKVAIYSTEDAPAGVENAYKRSPFYDPSTYESERGYPFFWETEGWSVKVGDLILCFEGEEKEITCEGVWLVQGILKGGAIIATKYVRNPIRLRLPRSDERKLAKLVKPLVDSGVLNMDGSLISIAGFARALTRQHKHVKSVV
jgi:hypothetical protein